MIEAEVIAVMRQHLEGLFPRSCSNCHRSWATLREYLEGTTHLGAAVPYDAELGDWKPPRPLGTFTFANCPCGNTLSLTSHGMRLTQLWALLAWARVETQRRGMSPQALLNYLRERICEQVLNGPGKGPAKPEPPANAAEAGGGGGAGAGQGKVTGPASER